MSLWESVTWDIARAGGFTAYLLLTLAVAVGLALTLHWQSDRWPRLLNAELHNFLTLLSAVFIGVHILAVWVDPFTRFGWSEVFIPLVSHYRPLWMAFGIVALYLGVAIALSTWLRPYIGYTWWRRLHVLTLLTYALVTVHGIATGSDTRTWWGVAIYGGSILLVGTLLLARLLLPATAQGRAHPGWAVVTVLLVLAGSIATALGPLQAGWNSIANNGQGTGARTVLAAPRQGSPTSTASKGGTAHKSGTATTSPTPQLTLPFTALTTGTLTQQGPDATGAVTYTMHLTLSQGASGGVVLTMNGQADDSQGYGGAVTIQSTSVTLSAASANGSASSPLYTGTVQSLDAGGSTWRIVALLHGAGAQQGTLDLRLRLNVDGSGQVQGTAHGTSGSGGINGGNGGNTSGGSAGL